MAKTYPPLTPEQFETFHGLILQFNSVKAEKGHEEAVQDLTEPVLNSGFNIDDTVSYMLDRMTMERGGEPSDRGRIFSKIERKFKQDIEKTRVATLKAFKEQDDYKDLDADQLDIAVNVSLLMSDYFPMAAGAEADNPLNP